MRFLFVALTSFLGVLALRAGVFVYVCACTRQTIGKGAVAEMLNESVSLWLGLTVLMAAAYAVKHGV
jgi:hypothetical protein